jgi:hypothetical protein
MKKRRNILSRVGLGLLVMAALGLVILPIQVQAQVNCATAGAADFDNDGFTDAQECNGISLDQGAAAVVLFPSCVGTALPRSQCLDPNTRDLFVILVSATPVSLIPADPLGLISKPQAQGGLGIATHTISLDQAGADRTVSSASPQKAVRITESLNTTSGDILGFCNQGTPNDLDGCTVFTQRIINFVNSVYASVGQTPPAGLVDTYIRHTIAHENGHSVAVAVDYNSRFGGNHQKSGSGVVMEQSVSYSVKGGNVTFNISIDFADPDKTGAKLK